MTTIRDAALVPLLSEGTVVRDRRANVAEVVHGATGTQLVYTGNPLPVPANSARARRLLPMTVIEWGHIRSPRVLGALRPGARVAVGVDTWVALSDGRWRLEASPDLPSLTADDLLERGPAVVLSETAPARRDALDRVEGIALDLAAAGLPVAASLVEALGELRDPPRAAVVDATVPFTVHRDELHAALLEAGVGSRVVTMADGLPSVVTVANDEAAALAIEVFERLMLTSLFDDGAGTTP